jgi:hypothetical protein
METFLQEFEDFKEAVRRRAARITEQWKEEGTLPGAGQGTRPGRQGRRATTRCYASSKGAYADPDALQTQESEELLKAAGRPLLTGWKEIAQAVGGVSVRTVQRWAQKHGLPIGHVGRTVVADPAEIHRWKEQRSNSSLLQCKL